MLRTAGKMISCFGLAIMIATPSLAAGLNSFVGTWKNTNPSTRGILKIVIGRSGRTLQIRPYGACTPKPCDWGAQPGIAYAPKISSNLLTAANAATVVYKTSFSVTTLTLMERGKRLSVARFTHFTDGSRRTDYADIEAFRK
jgi:hypothetical protein